MKVVLREMKIHSRRDNVSWGDLGLTSGKLEQSLRSDPLHGGESRDAKDDEPVGSERDVSLPNETTNTARLGALQQLATSIAANTSELPHLEQSCLQYISKVSNLQEAAKQQAALVASKQEASKQFRSELRECERLASVLRAALKQHYGIRSEKLAEYNLQPFRGRKSSSKLRQSKKTQPEPSPVQTQPESTEAP